MSLFPTANAAEQLHTPDIEHIAYLEDVGTHVIPCTRCDLIVSIPRHVADRELAERVGDIDVIGWIVDKVHDAHLEAGR